jgi:hypothetical protein
MSGGIATGSVQGARVSTPALDLAACTKPQHSGFGANGAPESGMLAAAPGEPRCCRDDQGVRSSGPMGVDIGGLPDRAACPMLVL